MCGVWQGLVPSFCEQVVCHPFSSSVQILLLSLMELLGLIWGQPTLVWECGRMTRFTLFPTPRSVLLQPIHFVVSHHRWPGCTPFLQGNRTTTSFVHSLTQHASLVMLQSHRSEFSLFKSGQPRLNAIVQVAMNPANTVFDAKRLIGGKFQ